MKLPTLGRTPMGGSSASAGMEVGMKGESRGSSKHEDGEGAKSAGSGPVISGGHERRGAWKQIGHGRWEKEMGAARRGPWEIRELAAVLAAVA